MKTVTKNGLPVSSVRGIVRTWIEQYASNLGENVLEVGSRMHTPEAWWINNRDLALGKWTGIDMQEGKNVDTVMDVYNMPESWNNKFTGVLCCEVLEHTDRPWIFLSKLYDILRPNGLIVITVPWCFPLHNFPEDYFRYSPAALQSLLKSVGFIRIITSRSLPQVHFNLNDHGSTTRDNYIGIEPTHSYAIARKPL